GRLNARRERDARMRIGLPSFRPGTIPSPTHLYRPPDSMPLIPVLSPAQSKAWDDAAGRAGISLATLMETAGRSVVAVMARRYPERLRDGVVVAAGGGNNGGDGWVVARVLHQAGIPVWVATLNGEQSPLQREMAGLATSLGVRTLTADGPWPNIGLIVDALLGTGARGAPRPPVAALVERMVDLRVPIVAVDGPTGLDLEAGLAYLPIRCDLSITFGGVRRGHLLAREEAGNIVVVDIGHPRPDAIWPILMTDRMAADAHPPLHARDHKGDRGRVVVLGGNTGMTGAVRIAARSAFASGAGLVHVVAPLETVDALVTAEPDIQTFTHALALPISDALSGLIARSDAVVIGPGLGRQAGAGDFVLAVLEQSRHAVIDADALTVLQGRTADLEKLARTRSFVLTPHPGEFRTLFPEQAPHLESDPWSAAEAASLEAQSTVLLKGVPTVVARAGHASLTISAGNPGLATGGSGDLLSGIVAAMLARGVEPEVAAGAGAQALGRAADLAARRSSARSLRPMDVITALPDLWRTWEIIGTVPPIVVPPILYELELPQLY
ncbi:MAG: NAD(P)H-hydrate dehydratase, partial [Gemmatimonadota bacterium]